MIGNFSLDVKFRPRFTTVVGFTVLKDFLQRYAAYLGTVVGCRRGVEIVLAGWGTEFRSGGGGELWALEEERKG